MIPMEALRNHILGHPYPLAFATISGAHLYGFPSPDSDFDLRGAHLLPLREVVGLRPCRETVDTTTLEDGMELDLVTHDVKKFFGLMLKKNGYVLEQVCSPLIVHTTPAFERLQEIAPRCVTRHHWHHYRGFAATQWKLIQKESPPRIKPLLYLYRVLMTGIHMMQSGEIEANIITLNDTFRFSFIDELVQRKVSGREKEPLADYDSEFHESRYRELSQRLEEAGARSTLPETATCQEELNELLVELRLAS